MSLFKRNEGTSISMKPGRYKVLLKQVGQFLATNRVFRPKYPVARRVLVHIIKPCKRHSHVTKPFVVHLLMKYFQLFEYIFAF